MSLKLLKDLLKYIIKLIHKSIPAHYKYSQVYR